MAGAHKLVTGSGGSVTIQAKDGLATAEVMEFFGYDATGVALAGADLTALNIIGTNPYATLYPDGSIVGGSDNGEFTMLANGNLECRAKQVGTISTTAANVHEAASFSLPIAFSDTNYICHATGTTVGISNQLASVWGKANTISAVQLYVATGTGAVNNIPMGYLAIGRWK